MSWFDTAGIANFAKSALTTAQKTIDKALDIQDENSKSGKHVKQPKDTEHFFEAFGLGDASSTSKSQLQPPVTRNVVSDSKSLQLSSDTQASGFWTDTWGSFFEMKTENLSKHSSSETCKKDTNVHDNDRKDDCVLSQPHRANIFPDENFLKSNQDNLDDSLCKLEPEENEVFCKSEQTELQVQNLVEIETFEKESNLSQETIIVTEQPANGKETLTLSQNSVSSTSMPSVSDNMPVCSDKNLVQSSNCDNTFISDEIDLDSNICIETVPNTELNFNETKCLENSEYLNINFKNIHPETPRRYEAEYDVIDSENEVSCNVTEDFNDSFTNFPSVETVTVEPEPSIFDINSSTIEIQDMSVNLSESVINWEWGSMGDNVPPSVCITDQNLNPDIVDNSKSKIDPALPVMSCDSSFHNISTKSFDKNCAWVQNPKSSHFIDESQNSSNEEQNSHHSDGSSNSSKDDDDTDTAEVKEYDAKSSSSTGSNATSSSSFVKCSGDENDHSHRGQSPVSTTASEKSDATKHESEQNTSGDENETATSSDIEILSPPNGENGDRNASPLKHIWLPRPLRFRRSESPTSDSSKDSLMPVVNELEEVSFEENRTGCEKDYSEENDFQHLLQKQEELQTILDAREKKILELSKENIELQENEQRLKNLVQKMRTDQAKESRDIAALTKEFTQRLAQVENQLRDAVQERDSLRIELEETKIEISKRMSAADTEEIIKEKDTQIKELIEEGQKLSKKELQHNTIIKKLRAKEEEMDRTIKAQSEKLEENSKEVERLRKSIGAKEEQEKKHIDAIRQLTNSVKKFEKQIASLKSTLEDNTEKELSLKKSLESTYKDFTELKKMYAAKEQELEDLKSGLETEAKENLRQMLDNADKEAAREKEILLLQMQELRCALSRADEEANLREKMLKADIASLQKRLQEGEERNEDLTKNMSSATRPLVRQIENLQSSFNTQILSWEKIEKSLTDRLSEAQNQLALMSEKERSATEKYMEYQSKVAVLETQNNTLRQEKLQLSTELESLKAKIMMLEENKDSFMRMTPEIFDEILTVVKPAIEKQNTFWRKSIPADERLALTLRFLATGETYRSLGFAFRIGRQTVRKIIPETCKAIWDSFKDQCLPFPKTSEEWQKIAKNFENKWQLPHCCGSIDGKHVLRDCPSNTGSLNFNYKRTYSTVLLAVADANYKFIMIDYGHFGSESDGGILTKTTFGRLLINNKLKFPPPDLLPKSTIEFPYFIVGDEAFPLRENLLRPFPRHSRSMGEEKIYNYRICRGRRVVENAFGILAARFRIFRRPLNYSDSSVRDMVVASCVLHNLLTEKSEAYRPANDDEANSFTKEAKFKPLKKMSSNMYKREAKYIREKYKNYLCNQGAVPWQNKVHVI